MNPTSIRRSFVRRETERAGACLTLIGDAAVAADYGRPDAEAIVARRLGLVDLSPLPRIGFKGAGAPAWLRERGLVFEATPNRAFVQPDGSLAAMLSWTEAFILPDPGGAADLARFDSWSLDTAPGCYRLERRDSHYWFAVTGSQAATMFSKICPVDLNPRAFSRGMIAQTTAARSSIVVIRVDRGDAPAFHLLGDCAAASYLWSCLIDAMAEYGGAPVGLSAWRELGKPS
ncbi:MAG: sarcosine oxidase [Alphaproteobacteria bacterium]|nr:sarcosine oxidase [Alphaproteobacteria bacterium]